jgi:hypothetical protein
MVIFMFISHSTVTINANFSHWKNFDEELTEVCLNKSNQLWANNVAVYSFFILFFLPFSKRPLCIGVLCLVFLLATSAIISVKFPPREFHFFASKFILLFTQICFVNGGCYMIRYVIIYSFTLL